eukprot:5075283-Alexandrium_andersonii.AAC.1
MGGDFTQVANADKVHIACPRGSFHFGRLANIDEVYSVFRALGIIDDADARRGKDLGVHSYGSAFNAFLQYGAFGRATKTAGSHGLGNTPPVSFAMVGNIHPQAAIPMLRGDTGAHIAATRERFLFYTAPRVAPHQDLPAAVELPDGASAHTWVPLDAEMAALCKWQDFLLDPAAAAAAGLQRVPDTDGHDEFYVTFPDGVKSRLRYTVQNGTPVAEFRVADRNIRVPPSMDVAECTRRLLDAFATPHMTMRPSPEARSAFLAAQTFYNVHAGAAVDVGNVGAAARWGTAPWHLGVLSATMLAWDIFIGAATKDQLLVEGALQIDAVHVARARKLISSLHGLLHHWSH